MATLDIAPDSCSSSLCRGVRQLDGKEREAKTILGWINRSACPARDQRVVVVAAVRVPPAPRRAKARRASLSYPGSPESPLPESASTRL